MSLRFTKIEAKPFPPPDQIVADTEAANPVPGPWLQTSHPFLLARALACRWEAPFQSGKVLQAADDGPQRVTAPNPCRCSPERGFFWGSKLVQPISTSGGPGWASDRPAHLISTSPPGDSHPPPAQPCPVLPSLATPEAQPPEFLKSRQRISIREEPAGLELVAPAGEGTAGPQNRGK